MARNDPLERRVIPTRLQRALRQMENGQPADLSRMSDIELGELDNQTTVNRLFFSALVDHERRLRRIEELLRGKGHDL